MRHHLYLKMETFLILKTSICASIFALESEPVGIDSVGAADYRVVVVINTSHFM